MNYFLLKLAIGIFAASVVKSMTATSTPVAQTQVPVASGGPTKVGLNVRSAAGSGIVPVNQIPRSVGGPAKAVPRVGAPATGFKPSPTLVKQGIGSRPSATQTVPNRSMRATSLPSTIVPVSALAMPYGGGGVAHRFATLQKMA